MKTKELPELKPDQGNSKLGPPSARTTVGLLT